MSTQHIKPDKTQAALIYCRVSSTKQKLEGSGLDSQEHRCRQYAEENGYAVEAVFPDDSSGGGDFMKRPGMVALLSFLDAQAGKPYVVIFDDLKRFARDTEFHIKLRREFDRRGARPECLNFTFEETPEGEFIETIIAAQGQLERKQNRRQVIQKMKARVEKGYWVFKDPVGYRYGKDKVHGKLLMRDEPVASILVEALEGYASGRFSSQTEVKRFLESKPAFPKSGPSGYVHPTKVKDILMRAVYAGYVEATDWGVGLCKGHHEPLISWATYERVQERLRGNVYAPARKDINEDFPLRGFVACDDCGQPLTSCWSKGKQRRYPYYLCSTKGCPSRRKSIPRAEIEGGAEEILCSMQPVRGLFEMAKAMFADIWASHRITAEEDRAALLTQLKDIDRQIDSLLDRIVEATSTSVVRAYEQRIEKLEREKLSLTEKASKSVPEEGRYEELIEHALGFLANPWKLYKKGGYALKRTVLKLAFPEPLRHDRKAGYRTPPKPYPFRVLDEISKPLCSLVEPRGIEPLTS
ncbi:MAG: recombinase family protein [Pseudomonadota bacterium]